MECMTERLIHAIESGKVKVLEDLLGQIKNHNDSIDSIDDWERREPYNVNSGDAEGTTPLFAAVQQNGTEMAAALVSSGAEVSSLLRNCLQKNLVEYVGKAIELGARADPESLVFVSTHGDATTLNLLLGHGGKERVNEEDVQPSGDDENPYEHTYTTPLFAAVKHGHVQCMDMLLSAGASVNRLLLESLEKNDEMCLQKSLDLGASSSADALVHASRFSSPALLRLLLCPGISVNDVSAADGISALSAAVQHDRPEIINVLLSLGADINSCSGGNPLMYAIDGSNVDCAQLLLEAGASVNFLYSDETPVLRACRWGLPDILKLLIEKGADVNETDSQNRTPLMVAFNLDCIWRLLEAGADVDRCSADGKTALMFALADPEPKERVQLLLNYKPNLNTMDNTGTTALMLADSQLRDLLLEHGADIKTMRLNLKHACRKKIRETCKVLDIPDLPLPLPLKKYVLYE